jgi:ATP-binding cassette subfamily F protein 3
VAAAAASAVPPPKRKQSPQDREREKPLRARLKKIEALVATMDTELKTLQDTLEDPAIYDGPTNSMLALTQRQVELRREKDTLEAEWLVVLEELEA